MYFQAFLRVGLLSTSMLKFDEDGILFAKIDILFFYSFTGWIERDRRSFTALGQCPFANVLKEKDGRASLLGDFVPFVLVVAPFYYKT